MNTKEILYESIIEIKKLLSKKEITALELTQLSLDRIEETNDKTNAFLYVAKNEALEDAKKIDKKISAGEDIGPLGGIPTSIKDLEPVKGMPHTNGSLFYKDNIADFDQLGIERIRNAGGIILGKTNTPEFGLCATTDNRLGDDCKNPWDLTCTSGGSSGGAGAAVASGVHPLAQGSDGGGSVRIPSGLCGIYGIKGTQGRIPRYHAGLQSWNPINFSCMGPMSWYVKDSAIMLQVMSGPHPNAESTAIQTASPDFLSNIDDGIKGKKIGIPKEYRVDGMSKEIEDLWSKGIDYIKECGAEVINISLPHTSYALPAYYIVAPAEASSNLARYDGVKYGFRSDGENLIDMYEKTRSEGFGNEVKRRIMIGTYVLSSGYYDAYYLKAQKVRKLIKNDFDEAYKKVDAILTPSTPSSAFKIGEKSNDPVSMYLNDIFTVPVNLAGLPGISIPAGLDKKGYPLGLQIIGKAFDEQNLLNIAYAMEEKINFKNNINDWWIK